MCMGKPFYLYASHVDGARITFLSSDVNFRLPMIYLYLTWSTLVAFHINLKILIMIKDKCKQIEIVQLLNVTELIYS